MQAEDFIAQQTGEQLAILSYLHHKLTTEFGLESRMRYGIPFYDRNKWICYLNPIKNSGIELAFVHGHILSNTQGILLGKGRKQVAGIDIYALSEIPVDALDEVLHEAILVDERSK